MTLVIPTANLTTPPTTTRDKTFTLMDNLQRHQRELCRKAKRKSESAVKDPIPKKSKKPDMKHSEVCNIDVPTKAYASPQRSQTHKNNSCTRGTEGVQLIA